MFAQSTVKKMFGLRVIGNSLSVKFVTRRNKPPTHWIAYFWQHQVKQTGLKGAILLNYLNQLGSLVIFKAINFSLSALAPLDFSELNQSVGLWNNIQYLSLGRKYSKLYNKVRSLGRENKTSKLTLWRFHQTRDGKGQWQGKVIRSLDNIN